MTVLLRRSSQHYQKIKKSTKDGGTEPTTPRKPSVGNNRTPKSGKSTGSKRKAAESFNNNNEDDEEPALSYTKGGSAFRVVSVDDNGSPKKIKVEHHFQNGQICKTEDLTEEGAVDLLDDA